MHPLSRLLRTGCVLAAVAVLSVGCETAADTQDFEFDDVALLAGLDTRSVLLAQQESIAACMAAEGFEYIPFVPPNAETYPDPGTLAALPDTEYVEDHGFGLAEQVLLRWASEDDDPNPQIVEALGPGERSEYFLALVGEPANDGAVAEGCASAAHDQDYIDAVQSVAQIRFDAVLRLEADGRYIEIMAEWSRCMAAEGLQFENRRSAILDYFGPKKDSVTVSRDEDALEALASEEILVAQADLACVKPHESALIEMVAEYEDPLVDDTRAYLQYLATLAETYGSRPDP